MKTIILIPAILFVCACQKEQTFPNYVDHVDTTSVDLKSTSQNYLPNAGGNNTTDWLDSNADGLSDGWMKDYPGIEHESTVSVKNGVPFIGRYQSIANRQQFCLLSPVVNLPYGYYCISLKYKANTRVRLLVRYNLNCGFTVLILPATEKVQVIRVFFYSNVRQIVFYNDTTGGMITLDEVNLIKQ